MPRVGISIDTDDDGNPCGEQRCGVPPAAKRTVQHGFRIGEKAQHFVCEHGLVVAD